MPRSRRIRLQHGRSLSTRRQAQAQPPGVQHGRGAGKSQGPAHGQGLGLGLYLLTVGAPSPGQEARSPQALPPALRDAVATAAAQGVNGTSPQSYAVTLPTYQAGDFVIVHVLWDRGSGSDPLTPTGWTLSASVQSGAGTTVNTFVYTRTMTGSEGATLTVQSNTASQAHFVGCASSWHHVSASAPVDQSVSATSGNAGSATWNPGALTVPGGNPRMVAAVVTAIVGGSATDIVPTDPATLAYDFLDSSHKVSQFQFPRLALAAYTPSTAGAATISGGFTSGGSANWGTNGLVVQGA